MKVSVIIPTVTLLLMFLIEEGLGISCYVCNSYLREKCGGDVKQYEEEFLTPCEANATACRKIEQEVFYEDDYNTRIIRQCAYEENPPFHCISRTGTYRFKISYCHCNEEGCNSGVTNAVSLTLVSLALGLAHFAGKHL